MFSKESFSDIWETELFYISGNGNPKKILIFQIVTFRARKMEKPDSEKTTYILRNGSFSPQA